MKQVSLSEHLIALQYKIFKDFLNCLGLILNLIQVNSTILYLKNEGMGTIESLHFSVKCFTILQE